jgi:hypothetical protein
MQSRISHQVFIVLWSLMILTACLTGCKEGGLKTSDDPGKSQGKKPWEMHGELRTDGHYLVYEDKTPFFYLGDTNWEFLMRARREDSEKLIKNRHEKGFTVMQTVITGAYIIKEGRDGGIEILKDNVYGDQPFIDADITQPLETPGSDPDDPEQYDFWDHVDYIVQTAAENDIYIGMIPCWHHLYEHLKLVNKQNARAYGKWLGERYKDTPNIIWILGGDTPGNAGDGEAMFDEMAAGLREGDGDTHLMTFHPRGRSGSSQWFHDRDWLDFNMIQSGHSMRDNPNYLKIAADYNRSPVKPCMDGEPRYEDHSVNWNPANGWYNDFDVRQAAYWSLFAGAHGHTYGVRGVWQMYEPGREKRGPLNYYWYEAMDLPGGTDMKHVKDLMLSRPFLSRIPDQTLVVETYEEGDHIQATRGDGYAFIYIPTGKAFHARLDKINVADSINAWWFSPRDGLCYNGVAETIREDPFTTITAPFRDEVEFDPPGEPGRGNDWVLVLDDASIAFPVPGTIFPGNK